jgi:hypothetical protein
LLWPGLDRSSKVALMDRSKVALRQVNKAMRRQVDGSITRVHPRSGTAWST